jgi:periplasmic protein CpxP/Spy
MTEPIDNHAAAPRPPRRRWLAGAALGAAFLAGGLLGPAVISAAEEASAQMGHGPMGHHGDMHAMAMAHVNRMLDQVGASADQKTRINAILKAGFEPMGAMHADMRQTHERLHAILSAPTIDRAALEQLRAAQIAKIDQVSRGMVKAMADAAEVLTPEQRAKLTTMKPEHHAPPS